MIRNLRTHTHTNREVLPVLKWCGTMSCGERAGKLDVEHFGLKYKRIPYKFLQILQDFSMYLRLMLQGIAFAFVATLASTFEFHSLVIYCVDLVAQYIGECSSLQWVALSAFGTLLLVWFLLLRPLLTREGCMEQYSQSKKPLLTRRTYCDASSQTLDGVLPSLPSEVFASRGGSCYHVSSKCAQNGYADICSFRKCRNCGGLG